MDQVFHHLETDEPATDHHSPLGRHYRLETCVRVHARSIRNIPVKPLRKSPGRLARFLPRRSPGDQCQAAADGWVLPRRQDELVVFLGSHLASKMVLELHGLLLGRDTDRLATRPAVDGELFSKGLFCRYQEAETIDHRPPTWYGSPQLAYETYGPRSTMRMSAFSSSLRRRAAHEAPPATPPTIMIFLFVVLLSGVIIDLHSYSRNQAYLCRLSTNRSYHLLESLSILKSVSSTVQLEANRRWYIGHVSGCCRHSGIFD